jgi:hypothetical protein
MTAEEFWQKVRLGVGDRMRLFEEMHKVADKLLQQEPKPHEMVDVLMTHLAQVNRSCHMLECSLTLAVEQLLAVARANGTIIPDIQLKSVGEFYNVH